RCGSSLQRNDAGVWPCEYPGLSFQRSPVCACSLVSSLLLSGATMSQQSSLTQSAHSVRQVLTAYNKKLPAKRITVAFCWSHLRREFFRIAERGDAPTVARIAQIYVIEKDVRGTSADERRVERQARSRPLVDALRIFFEHQLARLSGGSDTARIIRYGLRHWDGLTRFLDDGRIELDTNIVERSMRPQALTRKN